MAPIGKISGVAKTGFSKVDNVLAANIGGVDNTSLVLGPAPGTFVTRHAMYNFNLERGLRSPWRPSNALTVTNALGYFDEYGSDQCAWINGVPDNTSNGGDLSTTNSTPTTTWNSKEIRPWWISFKNVGDSATGGATTSNNTGPGGGLSTVLSEAAVGIQSTHVPDSPQNGDSTDNQGGKPRLSRFIFTENSTGNHGNGSYSTIAHVTRLLFINPVGSNGFMQDQNNDLELRFFYHARGNGFGSLQVWGGTNNSIVGAVNANDFYLNNISSPQFGGKLYDSGDLDDLPQPSITSNYTQVNVSLSDMKNAQINNSNQKVHCLYFVHQGMSNWDSDLAIDDVQIREVTP